MLTNLIRAFPDEIHYIEVIGRIDNHNVDTVREMVDAALARNRTHLLLDLHSVEYINSAGLRALVQFYKQVKRRNGSLILINPSENVQRLLNLVGLDSVLDIQYDARWTPGAVSPTELPARNRDICYCL